ncbi:MAG: serine/threonine protein kinase [Deltaproteobacteria bacterium]|nr:serine/threonine protein kinase [Deltaproteobacteria bacterium]
MGEADADAGVLPTIAAAAVNAVADDTEDDRVEGVLTALGRAAAQARLFDHEQAVLLGRYVALRHLGSGGMGDVFVAYDPQLDRKLALKLLRPTSATDDAASARLLREAQAMARLSHPNVIAVHDVGTHGGRVFVAMELVDGVTLREWSATPHPVREIVDVVLATARGVAAAHAAGVVHRDLKPDNIMVDTEARVRVMDFGLARELDGGAADVRSNDEVFRVAAQPEVDALALPLTQHGVVVGTPAYMSPEQLRGLPLDARSDQFSLCVVAWEALFGARPFRGRTVRELLAAMAARTPNGGGGRSDVPRWLLAALERGLAPVPEERFESMDAFIDAIARGQARARTRRLGGAAVVLGVLGLGALGANELSRARGRAGCVEEGAGLAEVWNDDARERLSTALRATGAAAAEDTIVRAVPWLDRFELAWREARVEACTRGEVDGVWTTETLARSRQCLDERKAEVVALLDAFEHADTAMLSRVVQSVAGLSGLEDCTDPDRLARRGPEPADEGAHADRLELVRAEGLGQAGRHADARAAAAAVAERAAASGDEILAARANVVAGRHAEKAGDAKASAVLLRDAFERAGRLGQDSVAADAATALVFTMGDALRETDAGLAWGATAAMLLTRTHEEDELRGAVLSGQLGNVHWRAAQYDEGVAAHERALAIKRRVLGDEHPSIAVTLFNLANVEDERGDHERAWNRMLEALAMFERELGPMHPAVGNCANNLGSMANVRGDLSEAVGWYERALAIKEASAGPESLQLASSLGNLGNVELQRGRTERALELHRRALDIKRARFGEEHLEVAESIANVAKVERTRGNLLEALRLQRRALEIREREVPADHPDVIDSLLALALVHVALGEDAQAQALYERASEASLRRLGPDDPNLAAAVHGLGNIALRQRRFADAVPLLEQSLSIRERAGVDPITLATARESLAQALDGVGGDRTRARALMDTARRDYAAAVDPELQARASRAAAWLAAHPP